MNNNQNHSNSTQIEENIPSFDTLFDTQLNPAIKELSELRTKLWRKSQLIIALLILGVIIIGVLCMFYMRMDAKMLGVVGFLSLFIPLFAGKWFYDKQKEIYDEKYKDIIARKLVCGINKSTTYTPSEYISQQEFIDSGIFLRKIEEYEGKDLVETTYGKTKIKFSTLDAKSKSLSINNKGETKGEVKTFFDGIFLIADSHRQVKGSIVILPDIAESVLGGAINNFRFTKRRDTNLVFMDNAKFEKFFQVYSEDPVEVQYILTPVVLERLVELQENKKFWGLSLSLKDDKIYICFRFIKGMDKESFIKMGSFVKLFEAPKLWGEPDFRTILSTDYEYLKIILNIIDVLDLNNETQGKMNV